jgi:hypothetical protein
LIIVCKNNSIHFWNFNDGSFLLQIQPQLYSATFSNNFSNISQTISKVLYITIPTSTSNYHHSNPRKFLLLGTELGNICGFEENDVSSLIENTPLFFYQCQERVIIDAKKQKKLNFIEDTKKNILKTTTTKKNDNTNSNYIANGKHINENKSNHFLNVKPPSSSLSLSNSINPRKKISALTLKSFY